MFLVDNHVKICYLFGRKNFLRAECETKFDWKFSQQPNLFSPFNRITFVLMYNTPFLIFLFFLVYILCFYFNNIYFVPSN